MKDILSAAVRSIAALAAAVLMPPAFAQRIPQIFEWNIPSTALAGQVVVVPLWAGSPTDPGFVHAITYTTEPSDACNVSGQIFTLVKPGVCTITVSNSGDDKYLPLFETASVTVTWDLGFALPPAPVRVGDAVTAAFAWTFFPPWAVQYSCAMIWGDPPGVATMGSAASSDNHASCTLTHTYATAGAYEIQASISHPAGDRWEGGEVYVYDPASRLSGSGAFDSPPGAFARVPSLSGSFTFHVASSYAPGADRPTGDIAFALEGGDMPITFNGTGQYVLAASGQNARLIGVGADQSGEQFLFELSFSDGTPGKVRVMAWDVAGNLAYDSQPGDPFDSAPATALTAGDIAVTSGTP